MKREPRKLVVTRLLTKEECDWLDRTYQPGEVFYECIYNDYGCVDREKGIAATESPEGDYPFFEVPHNAVEWLK